MDFSKRIKIGKFDVDDQSMTLVIAEIGVNHNGNMQLAKKMINAAKEAGADIVKFQAFKTDKLILNGVERAKYQKYNCKNVDTQAEMLKKLELSNEELKNLKEYCEEIGVMFLATPFDIVSLEYLESINVDAYKVAATDITNIKFLREIAERKKPIILSAGMCYMEEVEAALNAISEINNQVILLQCSANYPIKDEDANLKVIQTFKNRFDMVVGYSDHSQGIGASPYAVALGAKVIEKHFTLDRDFDGPDHKASICPEEFKDMVAEIRRVEKYLGNGMKYPSMDESYNRCSLQKYLVASVPIRKGEVFSQNNIVAKRTDGRGLSASYYDRIIGTISSKDFNVDEIIEL